MPSAANDIDDKGAALLEAAASGRLDAVRDLIDRARRSTGRTSKAIRRC